MNIPWRWLGCLFLVVAAPLAHAAFHMFRIEELYSNADGSVQFVVLLESAGLNNENLWVGQSLRATPTGGAARTFTFPNNLPSNTASRRVLVATPGFAALGLVAPDFTMPAGFLPAGGGTVSYAGVSQVTFAALPTDGSNALFAVGTVGPTSPPISPASRRAWPAGRRSRLRSSIYNADLDHYFLTHNANEIADPRRRRADQGLDTHRASVRGLRGRRRGTSPVCRFYIPRTRAIRISTAAGRPSAPPPATRIRRS